MPEEFDPLYKWLGIPPDEQPPHCYRLLGLRPFEDNADAIESAADRLMAYLRTFQTGPNVQIAQEVLSQVAAAKAWLMTPDRKAQYDAWLREQLAPVGPPPPPAAAPPIAGVAPRAPMAVPDLSDVLGDTDPYLESRRRSQKRRQRQWAGVIVSFVAAVGAAVALGLVVWKLMEANSQEGKLVIQWPEEERAEGTLEVEGKRVSLPAEGEITVDVPAGRCRVVCARPGFKPYDVTIAATAGKVSAVEPKWRDLNEKIEEVPAVVSDSSDDTPEKADAPKKGDEKPKASKAKDDEFSFDKKGDPSTATDKKAPGDAMKQ